MKKSTIVLSMLVAASSVFAVNNEWIGGTTGDYNDAANWNKGHAPAGEDAMIREAGGVSIDLSSSPSTNPRHLFLANSGGALNELTINNSTLNATGHVRVGYDRSAWTGSGAANGLLTLNNATVTVGQNLEIGAADGSSTSTGTGVVVMNDGTLNATQIILGTKANTVGTLTLNGGATTVNNFKLALHAGSIATLNLNGGSLTVNNGWSGLGTSYISISEGTVSIAGNSFTGKFQDIADAGRMTVSGGLTDASAFAAFTTDAGSFASANGTAYWGTDGTTTALWSVAAIPEPATLSMVAALGGGILFIRRRFMA